MMHLLPQIRMAANIHIFFVFIVIILNSSHSSTR